MSEEHRHAEVGPRADGVVVCRCGAVRIGKSWRGGMTIGELLVDVRARLVENRNMLRLLLKHSGTGPPRTG